MMLMASMRPPPSIATFPPEGADPQAQRADADPQRWRRGGSTQRTLGDHQEMLLPSGGVGDRTQPQLPLKSSAEAVADVRASDGPGADRPPLQGQIAESPPAEAPPASTPSLPSPCATKSLAELIAEANATERREREGTRLRAGTESQARAQRDAERRWAAEAAAAASARAAAAAPGGGGGDGIGGALREILFQAKLDRQEQEDCRRRARAEARAGRAAAGGRRLAVGSGAPGGSPPPPGLVWDPLVLDAGRRPGRGGPAPPEGVGAWRALRRLKSWEGPLLGPISPFGGTCRDSDDDDDDARTHMSAPANPEDEPRLGDGATPVLLDAEDPADLAEFPLVLTPGQMAQLAERALPPSLTFHRWRRAYSLARDGDSFGTFLRRAGDASRSLLVVRDTRGDVFGAYADSPWRNPDRAARRGEFFGTAQACLWTVRGGTVLGCYHDEDEDGEVEVYGWTGENRYIQFLDVGAKMIALGGGGKEGDFGLCLEDDFRRGSTGPCGTFGNEPLCSRSHFNVVDVECWEFLPGFG